MKRYLFFLIIILFTYVAVLKAANSQYIFRHLDIANGLSDNQIRGISMAPDGRIAIKTASIINIYNGANFEHFYHDKSREYKWNHWGGVKNYYDKDSRLWVKERDYLIILDLKSNRLVYDIKAELRKVGVTGNLKDVYFDDSKNLWMLTENNGFSYYDVSAEELVTVHPGGEDFYPREIIQVGKQCWIIYSNGLIRWWDYNTREFIHRDNTFVEKIDGTKDRLYLHATPAQDVWLMYNHAVYFYESSTKSWSEICTIDGRANFFTCMDIDSHGNVWAGTSQSGLRIIEAGTFKATALSGIELESGGIVKNDIYSIFIDDNDGVWVGTLFQGICYYQPGMKKFRLFQVIESETLLTNENVRCFKEQKDGAVLVGTAQGVFRYEPDIQRTELVYPALSNELCLVMYEDKSNRLWVGTFHNGFFCIEKGSIKNYRTEPASPDRNTGMTGTARDIYEDDKGRFWVSVAGGVGRFYPETGKIDMLYDKHPRAAEYNIVYKIYPMDDGSFAAVGENGIFYYNPDSDNIVVPEKNASQGSKSQNVHIKYYFVFQDSRSLKWFGTEEGLICRDEINDKTYRITVKNGLPNNMIVAMQENAGGFLWVSSPNGLSRIGVDRKDTECSFSIVNFGTTDGLQNGKFYENSSIKATDGTLYFGGVHGFNAFMPDKIVYNQNVKKPIFTSFSLFNTQIQSDSLYNNRIILPKPINHMEEIVLRYNENFIGIEFAGLNYVNPSQTYFRYQLENFDSNWTEILSDGSARVTYTGLQPGTYRLIVYGANNDKVWGTDPAIITIIIKPPFWATGYAYFVYFLVLIALVILLVYWITLRNRKKLEVEREANERKQKDELDQMKFRFFTNVSHEFRTPLTLIITPLELLIKNEERSKIKERLSSIYRNARDLQILVNQLLDFRKLEMKGEELNLDKNDVTEFIENIYIQFKDTISSRDINFNFSCDKGLGMMWFDRHKMHKVMNNLLSNALKFTPSGGQISLEAGIVSESGREMLRITVADTGRGIGKEEQGKIFERFYQDKNNERESYYGSGIGLHLVKEYVRLHEGRVEVESEKGQGSKFRLYIPTGLAGKESEPISTVAIDDTVEHLIGEPLEKTILVVEDNTEFRHFLIEHLSEYFKVIDASDGDEALQIAEEECPDLIVSDFMMPKMSGVELCRYLKSNIKTSHIPFILLTARSSDDARMEGYDAGADSYISKPFNFEMLLVRVNKLIEQQEKRQELFHKTIEITPSSITVNSLDEEFIQKVLRCVENNMSNTEYSIEQLSSDVAMHRSHLYRKLRSITGQTPIDFMRLIRLKRSAQLLIDSQYNVSEIADMAGFNTLKYFNKYFKEEFDMTPSQYRAEHIKAGSKDVSDTL